MMDIDACATAAAILIAPIFLIKIIIKRTKSTCDTNDALSEKKTTIENLTITGAHVGLSVVCGKNEDEEVLQLIDFYGNVQFQRSGDGSDEFWKDVDVGGSIFIAQTMVRLWKK